MHEFQNQEGSIKECFEAQVAHKIVKRTESLEVRIKRLSKLRKWIHENRPAIHKAIYADLHKPSVEVDAVEIFPVLNEIKHALSNLHQWVKPKKIRAPLTMLGTRSYIHFEPKGVCLIISPWNYPFNLAIGPLVSAIAAGNAVIIKPSELTFNVASLLKEMIETLFDKQDVALFTGGVEVAEELLQLPFNHIFFTGSPRVGKIIMKAAAQHLSSVTLELGGKSPTIVTADANLHEAAKRIAIAKFINNGQTCIAPDYILAEHKIIPELVAALKEEIKSLFSFEGSFQNSPSYARIVNQYHFDRLTNLLLDAEQSGAQIIGKEIDSQSRFMSPVIVTNVHPDAQLLQEEIFGPVLPIIPFTEIDQAIKYINQRPAPLALYVFSGISATSQRIVNETSAGGVCINDCAVHFLHRDLPFGGVNNSGIGKSHGYYGFMAFSNEKPVLKQKNGFTMVQLFYPPYNQTSKRLMDWFLKLF